MDKLLMQRSLELCWGHEVETRPIDWLWEPWLARGVVEILDGDPGVGKSSLTMDFVARITTGRPFPNSECGIRNAESTPTPPTTPLPQPETRISIPNSEFRIPNLERNPQCAIVVSLEDPLDQIVVPRLTAAGADLTKVALLGGVRETGPDGANVANLQLPRDLGLIRAKCVEYQPALLVIDPLFAVLGYDEDGRFIKANDDQSVRRLTGRLKRLAEDLGITILLVRHLNKATGGKAIKRGSGSIALSGQARAVMVAGCDPDGIDSSVLAMVKTNLSPKPRSWRYRVAGSGAGSRIEWLNETDLAADDLTQPRADDDDFRRHASIRAKKLLLKVLSKAPRTWEELIQLAREQEITEITLRRAREEMRLEKKWLTKGCLWALPDNLPMDCLMLN